MATTIKSRKKNQQKSVPTLLQAIEKVVELAEDSRSVCWQKVMVSRSDRLCCSVSVWRKGRIVWIMMIWPPSWI